MTDPRTCPHDVTVPVDVRDHTTGGTTTVARICTTCLARLPTAWGCTVCEWVEIRNLCEPVPQRMLARPCQEHADAH